jgi:threonine 3-dehydrogenase
MQKKNILITGAAGEIGQALINRLSEQGANVFTLDLKDLPDGFEEKAVHYTGSIVDQALMENIITQNEINVIFHLAALLSTTAERYPKKAHEVNVGGTTFLLELAAAQSQKSGQAVQFIFPSSIAVYGMPDLETKARNSVVGESEFNYPATIYGVNKYYCELLGVYYSSNYKQLADEKPVLLDFRSVRFPGLISAYTVPSGGTSDYGPEMLHAAAQNQPYECFVREDTTISFMAMPDAITALLDLSAAPVEKLTRRVYNVSSFSLSAGELYHRVLEAFPDAKITYKPHLKRQGIIDTWPMDTDDSAARRDWGWVPAYSSVRCFNDYLVPNIKQRYQVIE